MRSKPFLEGRAFVLPTLVLHLVFASMALGFGQMLRAILQVEGEVGKLVAKASEAMDEALFSPARLAGLAVGIAIMYFTAFLVKF
jgi:hypothetical protein